MRFVPSDGGDIADARARKSVGFAKRRKSRRTARKYWSEVPEGIRGMTRDFDFEARFRRGASPPRARAPNGRNRALIIPE